jgi:ABC-type Zn uptake system ZnuABC Zn-binding protein ZnuA
MSEGIELPEQEEHQKHPLTIPVSVTMAILAVVGAIVTLLGHRAHTEELLLQAKATDQWAYYQAKNIRLHEMQAVADMLGALAPQDKEKTAAVHEKYVKEVERYENDKDDISEKAKELEAERDMISRRADRFDGGEVLLEVGLVICSITLLTKRRLFWITGILFGFGGLVLAATGFLVH